MTLPILKLPSGGLPQIADIQSRDAILSNILKRLSDGTNSHIIVPFCSFYQTAGLVIYNTLPMTFIPYQAADIDPWQMGTSVSSNGIIEIPSGGDGIWEFESSVVFGTAAAANVQVQMALVRVGIVSAAPTSYTGYAECICAATTGAINAPQTLSVSKSVIARAGERFATCIYQNNANPGYTSPLDKRNFFSATWIGPAPLNI